MSKLTILQRILQQDKLNKNAYQESPKTNSGDLDKISKEIFEKVFNEEWDNIINNIKL
jgi:hypothetical protein